MLIPESQVRIWLYGPPTDMRKSFDGLSALVRTKLLEDPLSGQLFVFINRRATQLKVLYYDRGGYCVWAKRLEQGSRLAHLVIEEPDFRQILAEVMPRLSGVRQVRGQFQFVELPA